MTNENLNRYSRQILYPAIGKEGQQRLLASRVALIGCGALGSSIANLLVRAGVGYLRIADRDFIETHNLQRQSLYDEQDIADNLPKAEAARRKLAKINSAVQIDAVVTDVRPDNIESLIKDCDLILDGTDNFETRYLINDLAIKQGIPWIYGACVGSEGLVLPVLPGETPCLRCIFETPPSVGSGPTCDTAGILGSTVQVVAAQEVIEAIKILTGQKEIICRELLSINVWTSRFRTFKVARRTGCQACELNRFDFLEAEHSSRTTTLCGREAFQIAPAKKAQIELAQLRSRLEKLGRVQGSEFLLHFEIDPYRLTIFADGRAIVHGARDEAMAKSLYAQYIGI